MPGVQVPRADASLAPLRSPNAAAPRRLLRLNFRALVQIDRRCVCPCSDSATGRALLAGPLLAHGGRLAWRGWCWHCMRQAEHWPLR